MGSRCEAAGASTGSEQLETSIRVRERALVRSRDWLDEGEASLFAEIISPHGIQPLI